MSLVQERLNISFSQTQGIFNEYAYNPENGDTLADVTTAHYFDQSRFIGEDGWQNGIIFCNLADGFYILQMQGATTAALAQSGLLPPGGAIGDQLIKLSNASYDVGWGVGNTDFIPGKVVANYSALPPAASWPTYLAICQNSQGVWLINYKPKGVYYSDGVTWSFVSDYVPPLDEVYSVSVDTAMAVTPANYVYFCSGTINMTLPTAASNSNQYTVKNVGAGTITVLTTGGQTIDGSASVSIPVKYTSLTFLSDGTNWNII